ncbi:hypothetical protein P8C59_003917 [Phyllachora maydis]|uniref:Uncharacterized protein n=1 Tax=Phyllachora maydis TaxID=1825666 RepID=A0AAD9I1I9_9PEZI|nr:hypothetical protein P8C59_003917 [Phyllachora maydis]
MGPVRPPRCSCRFLATVDHIEGNDNAFKDASKRAIANNGDWESMAGGDDGDDDNNDGDNDNNDSDDPDAADAAALAA